MKIPILLLIILSSCAQLKEARIKRKCNNAIKYAKEHGCITFTDSINIKDSLVIRLDSQKVVNVVDSIIGIIHCDSLTDTLYLTRFKERVRTIVSNIPCEITPTMYANKEYSLKIWTKGGKLFYDLKIEPKPEKVCKDVKWWDRFLIGVCFCILVQLIFRVAFVKINDSNFK